MRQRIVMYMATNDEELVLAAVGGDTAAFTALLERHYDRLFKLCFRLTGRRTEAEDLTQDICAELPKKLAQFRGDAQFTTWLYRVAVNAVHDRRRRAAAHARATVGWGEWERNRRAAEVELADQMEWLTQTMRALPNDLRDTLALVLDGLTHAEAGQVLGVSEGTISWRLSITKKIIRAQRETEDQT